MAKILLREDGVEMKLPWESWITLRLPRHPVWIVVLVALALCAVYCALQLALGFSVSREPVLLSLLIGYSLAVNLHLTQSIERALAAEKEGPVEGPFFLMHPRQEVVRSRFGGGAGLVVGFLAAEGVGALSGQSPGSGWTELHRNTLAMPLLLLLTWMIGRQAYFSLAFSSGAELLAPPIDLLDLAPTYVRGRSGLRSALLWIVGVSLAGLFFVTESDVWVMIPVLLACVVVGAASLLLPMRGIAKEIRDAKADELARIRRLLRKARDAGVAGDNAAEPGRLADLLAFEAKIEGLSEWPIDLPTLRRFGLYLLIPLASMVGGALVERVVNAVLG